MSNKTLGIIGGGQLGMFICIAAKKIGLKTIERDVLKKEIYDADEVWLSSTGNEVRPVIKIDGESIGKNYALSNSVWRQLHEEYRKDTVSPA